MKRHLACEGLRTYALALQQTRKLWPHAEDPFPLLATEANVSILTGSSTSHRTSLLESAQTRTGLAQHCLLCNQWGDSPVRLKSDWRRIHPAAWNLIQGEAHDLVKIVSRRILQPGPPQFPTCTRAVTRNPWQRASRCAFQLAAARCLLRADPRQQVQR